jgi:hypothetical protein
MHVRLIDSNPQDTGGPSTAEKGGRVQSIAPEPSNSGMSFSALPRLQKTGARLSWDIFGTSPQASMASLNGSFVLVPPQEFFPVPAKNFREIGTP